MSSVASDIQKVQDFAAGSDLRHNEDWCEVSVLPDGPLEHSTTLTGVRCFLPNARLVPD